MIDWPDFHRLGKLVKMIFVLCAVSITLTWHPRTLSKCYLALILDIESFHASKYPKPLLVLRIPSNGRIRVCCDLGNVWHDSFSGYAGNTMRPHNPPQNLLLALQLDWISSRINWCLLGHTISIGSDLGSCARILTSKINSAHARRVSARLISINAAFFSYPYFNIDAGPV